MSVRVRFAPSPTGPLHIGGVRTALYNYLFARKHGGIFIVRVEDTDQNRFVPGAEEYIHESLAWLGISPDEGIERGGPYAPYRQSERKPMYREFAERLVNEGNAYYAFDTAEELDAMREKLKASGMSPQYDTVSRSAMKNSLTLSADEVKSRLESGEPYVIRIKLPRKEDVRFHDIIRGWVTVSTTQMDDKVLFKSDGMPTYHLANVVDDYLMKITHVIRGEEWLPSAPLHVMLYRFFGWEDIMPAFAHLPLLLKPDGNGKLSKRDGDRLGFPVFPLQWKDPQTGEVSSGYRESGYFPEAVINMLALLGWHTADNREIFSLDELVQEFSLERVSKHGAKFDVDKARWFNHQYLLKKSSAELAEYLSPTLKEEGLSFTDEYLQQVIALLKEKMSFPNEFLSLGRWFFADPESFDAGTVQKKWTPDIPSILQKMSDKLAASDDFNATSVEMIFQSQLAESGKKVGELMPCLRLAVSGAGAGPPLFEAIALLGKEATLRRLKYAIETIANP